MLENLKKGDGNKATTVCGGIAGFVPFCVVFAANNVKEVANVEAEVVVVLGRVVVEGFDDLCCLWLVGGVVSWRGGEQTFLGGRMVRADLGATEMDVCFGSKVDFSPFIERRIPCCRRVVSGLLAGTNSHRHLIARLAVGPACLHALRWHASP